MTDRELNEWMAVHVGGWTKGSTLAGVPSEVSMGFVCWRRNGDGLLDCPDYCHDGRLMLEVEDWLAKRGCTVLCCGLRVDLGLLVDSSEAGTYRWFCPDGNLDSPFEKPRALCELVHAAREYLFPDVQPKKEGD